MTLQCEEDLLGCFSGPFAERIQSELSQIGGIEAFDPKLDGVCVISARGALCYMNAALRDILGVLPQDDLSKLTWRVFCPPGQEFAFIRRLNTKLLPRGVWWGPFQALDRLGNLVDLDLSIVVFETGELLCVARGAAGHMAAEQCRALRAEVLYDAYARSAVQYATRKIGHDMANLVAVISGTTETLLDKLDPTDTVNKKGLGRILMAAEMAEQHVAKMQSMQRSDEPASAQELAPLIEAAIVAATKRYESAAQISLNPAGNKQFVWSNPLDCLMVCASVLCQANRWWVKGPLAVGYGPLQAPDDAPVYGALLPGLSYSKTTISFQADATLANFDQYFTSGANEPSGCAALSLEVLQAILLENRAALWFERDEGAACQLTIAWPEKLEPKAICPAVHQGAQDDRLSGHRILVVDDSPHFSDMLSKILDEQGAMTVSVTSPFEALVLVQDAPHLWSAIVTDLQMPQMSGLEMAQKVKDKVAGLPVILVTSQPDTADAQSDVFAQVLAKPVRAGELVSAVVNSLI